MGLFFLVIYNVGLNALFIDELIDSSDLIYGLFSSPLWANLLARVPHQDFNIQWRVMHFIYIFYQFVGQKKGQFKNILVHLYIYIYLNLPCAGIEWVHGPDLALGRSFSHPCSRCLEPWSNAYLFVSTLLFGFLAVTL